MVDISLNKNSFCISIDKNRYERLCKNFESVGLTKPQFFQGVNNGDVFYGCNYSHINLLKHAINLNLPNGFK